MWNLQIQEILVEQKNEATVHTFIMMYTAQGELFDEKIIIYFLKRNCYFYLPLQWLSCQHL